MKKSELRALIREEIQKLKVKKLIREEVKVLLTESTHATVGILNSNGSITSVYVHSDGYPDGSQGVGGKLKKYYNDTKKIKQLISLGDIYFIDKNVVPSGEHSYKNPEKDVTIAFGRDRGDKDIKPIKSRDKTDFIEEAGDTSYAYLWDPKAKQWLYTDIEDDEEDARLVKL